MLSQPSFGDWLEEKFIAGGVIGETVINKDNCETLFDSYLQRLDVQELLDLGTQYGQYRVNQTLMELRNN